jgi:serine/threonine protein kinase
LIRSFAEFSPEEIDKEAEVVSQLCRPGGNKHVVEVRRHAWLPHHSSYYYIDMEYCSENLENWIHGSGKPLAGDGQIGGASQGLRTLPQFSSKVEQSSAADTEYSDSTSILVNIDTDEEGTTEINWSPVVKVIEDICGGLIYIHEHGTVHRDLKPQNGMSLIMNSLLITVLYSENQHCWKIADFGTASVATSKRFHTTRYSRGTQGYRSPEILLEDGKYNNKADIFALGCILYEITTGQKLFSSDWAIREYSVGGNANIPLWPSSTPGMPLHSLGTLTMSMLSIDPLLRPSALEVREQLQLIRLGRFDESLIAPRDAELQVKSHEGGTKGQDHYKMGVLNATLPAKSIGLLPSIPPLVRPSVHPRYRQRPPSDKRGADWIDSNGPVYDDRLSALNSEPFTFSVSQDSPPQTVVFDQYYNDFISQLPPHLDEESRTLREPVANPFGYFSVKDSRTAEQLEHDWSEGVIFTGVRRERQVQKYAIKIIQSYAVQLPTMPWTNRRMGEYQLKVWIIIGKRWIFGFRISC